MKRKVQLLLIFAIICFAAYFMPSCSSNHNAKNSGRITQSNCLLPEAPGRETLTSDDVTADISNITEGYLMVRYTGDSKEIKVQLTGPGADPYTYTSQPGDYHCFPLSEGSGDYQLDVLENIGDHLYALVFSDHINARIKDEFRPFMYPNQFVSFDNDSESSELARKLSDSSENNLEFVEKVYDYTTEKIHYDEDKAANADADYIPDLDQVIASGKGICFDYAALMCAMLRSQGIPAKLVAGYSGTVYHAWVSVYLDETGWVDDMIEFDGSSWSLMDPTLASVSNSKSVRKYIGDGSNYTPQFYY